MERQKRKLKGIADLYNIEDERQRRQSISTDNIPQQNISQEVILEQTASNKIAPSNILQEDILQENISEKPENTPIQSTEVVTEPSSVTLPQNISRQDMSNSDI